MTVNEAMIHEEARRLAAEAVDLELAPDEAAWLERHLAACPDCAAVAAEYQDIHAELSGLAMPEPPRDLWARTQAALDQVDGAGRARRQSGAMSRTSLFGSSMAVLLVVLLAGASLISQSPIVHPASSIGSSAPIAAATTFNGTVPGTASTSQVAVVNGTNYWISGGNGVYAIMGGSPSCDPAVTTCTVTTGGGKTLGTIESQTSVSAVIAPDANVVAVWNTDKVVIVPLTESSKTVSLDQMTPQPTTVVTPAPTPVPTPVRTATPAVTATPAPTPSETSFASASPSSGQASPVASATAVTTETPKATASAASASPSPSQTVAPTLAPTLAPTIAPATSGPIAILSGYEIVGRDPEFSSDGRIVAFSARPSDHRSGPDVFVWQVGDIQAHAVTTSHSDQFAGWFGSRLLVSEIASSKGSAASGEAVGATSYVFDVASGAKLRISRPMLMPSVDPTGTYVVYWTGRVQFDQALGIWQPDGGDLYFDRWSNLALVPADAPVATTTPPPTAGASPTAHATPTMEAAATERPTSSATAAASVSPTASPSEPAASSSESAAPSPVASATPTLSPTPVPTAVPSRLPQRLPVASGPGAVRSWQVRWDAPGRHIAAWVADKGSAKVGRLSLYSVNDDQDLVDTDEPLLNAERVMSTIQFDSSHLVWTSAVDGNTYVQTVPAVPPSSVSTSSQPPATAPQTTDRPGA